MGESKNKGPHQAKNKPANYGTSDAIFGSEIKIQNPNASADERKTVILDEDLEGLEFEDRVWLFWRRNKNFVITLVALVFAVIIGKHAWLSYKASRDNALASEFSAAATFEGRAAFAKSNSGTSAAGVALLENADALYSEGKFAEAAEIYKSAAAPLKGDIFYGRALLGEAICVLKSGKAAEAEKLLQSLSANPEALSYSAEAAYHLGVLAYSQGKLGDAEKYFASAASNPSAGQWAFKAEIFKDRLHK
ncbi:MAG: tetratricopeptide repeat protein [Opitutales bacterium]|nr:tetratricopeptide repeat protein [Opitutales bacterium]